MFAQNESKLRNLVKNLQPGVVITIPLLNRLNISDNLRKYYMGSGWLETVGRGAYKKPGDAVEWYGAVNALQKQLNIEVHVGGLTALNLQGFGHYIRMEKEPIYLYSPQRTKLPMWFVQYNAGVNWFHKPTSFISKDLGIKEMEIKQITVDASTPERAILETLYLAPSKIDLVEIYQILEGMVNLKPKLLNSLLQNCSSVKIKRLFLYMAEKTNHQWFRFLELDKIELGSGRRMIAQKGVYMAKYLISIPKELAEL